MPQYSSLAADLNLVDGHGYFSIEALVIPELRRQLTG
jgi:hypothetical protein